MRYSKYFEKVSIKTYYFFLKIFIDLPNRKKSDKGVIFSNGGGDTRLDNKDQTGR